jgi:hypothetical protein
VHGLARPGSVYVSEAVHDQVAARSNSNSRILAPRTSRTLPDRSGSTEWPVGWPSCRKTSSPLAPGLRRAR